MFPLLLPMLIGGSAGALLSKKDPLRGALIGAGLGVGGAALPGLLSAGGATGTAGAATGMGGTTGILDAGASGAVGDASGFMGTGGFMEPASQAVQIVDKSVPAGMFDKANYMTNGLLDKGVQMAEPMGRAMQTAQMFQPQEKELPPIPQIPQFQPNSQGQQSLQQIASQPMQMAQMQQQRDFANRQKRREMILRMGGGYHG
jgi:hypothetical protein